MFPAAEADIVLSDHMGAYESIAEKLNRLHVFGRVYTAKIVDAQRLDTIWKKTVRVFKIIARDTSIVHRQSDLERLDYDELIFNSMHYFDACLYYELKKKNPGLILRRFEEGFSSGFSRDINMSGSARLQERLHVVLHRPSLHEEKTMYFYEPDMVLFEKGDIVQPLPKMDRNDEDMQRIIRGLFGAANEGEYDKKYIYFEGSYLADGIDMHEEAFVDLIAKEVGKENLIVKRHPRVLSDRFSERGIRVNQTLGVPWEAVIMSIDLSEKVFITIQSGSVLSPRILLGENAPTYMLYRCTPERPPLVDDLFDQYMDRFLLKYGASHFYIPENTEELTERIREEETM